MAALPGGGPAEDGSELRSHACGVAKVETRGRVPGVGLSTGGGHTHTHREYTQYMVCRRALSVVSGGGNTGRVNWQTRL